MKSSKLDTLSAKDIQQKQDKIIKLETKSGMKQSIIEKRIKENIIRNIYKNIIKGNEMGIKINKDCSFNGKNIDNNRIINKQKYYKIYNKMKKFRNNIISIAYITIITFNLILQINNNTYDITPNITLKINGSGFKSILSSYFDTKYYPNITIINGIKNTTRDYQYYLPQENNIIELVWDNNNLYSSYNMFRGCASITEIDFSNFDTSKVTNMNYMFYDCTSLFSLNLANFDTSKVETMTCMFRNCPSLSSLDLSNFNTSQVTNMGLMFYRISSLSSLDLSNFNTSKVEYMREMFYGCSSLISLDLSNFNTSQVYNMEEMFSYCSNLKYLNLKNFKEIDGLSVTDIFDGVSDDIIICLDIENINILSALQGATNYILNCSYFGYTEYTKSNSIKNIIENITKSEVKGKLKEEEIKYYDKILENLKETFTSENYDLSDLDNGEEEKIETEKMIITITTTENQKKYINNNTTNVDLSNCENLLRNVYNISNESMLYMMKYEIVQEEMKIPKIEYEIFSNLNGNNLEKLSLSPCKNIKINLLVPVEIKDSFDKLDSKSGYYNDICYGAKSESGTDISLKDRKNEYINKTVCQDGCDFNDYNYTIKKANCSCNVQESSKSFAYMKIDKKKLLANFKDRKYC